MYYDYSEYNNKKEGMDFIYEVINMGYILPITHYSYINYEYRMRKRKESPHYVEKPFKVILEEKRSNVTDSKSHAQETNDFKTAINVTPYVQADLIGKGHQINIKA